MQKSNYDLQLLEVQEYNCCPYCGGNELILDSKTGENICSDCGCVVTSTTLDRGPEWRAFNLKEKSERPRASSTKSPLNEIGMDTNFQISSDSSGRPLNSKMKRKMTRLKNYDTRSKLDGRQRNLSKALTILNRLVDELNLPKRLSDRAARIYRNCLDLDLIRGRTIAGFVAASVYAACREAKVPRSLSEISEISIEDNKDVSRIYRLLVRKLDLHLPIDGPMKFIPRIASELNIDRSTDRLSAEILRKARDEKMLVGKNPRGMVAAALYLACKMNDNKTTQKEIAYAAGTTEVTLRNRLRDLEQIEDIDRINETISVSETNN